MICRKAAPVDPASRTTAVQRQGEHTPEQVCLFLFLLCSDLTPVAGVAFSCALLCFSIVPVGIGYLVSPVGSASAIRSLIAGTTGDSVSRIDGHVYCTM